MKKKLLENPIIGAAVIPLAVILVGVLVVVGVSALLNSDPSYKGLVRTLQSKTFGNRWVAALELSKVIAAKGIPESDIPWLIENLNQLYDNAGGDPRTRNFIVVAAGALNDPRAVPLFLRGVEDADGEVRLHAVVALGNTKEIGDVPWERVLPLLDSPDTLLRQGAVLALATHRVPAAEAKMVALLGDSEAPLRYSAALGLIHYKNPRALPVLQEILFSKSITLDSKQHRALKINIMTALALNGWREQVALAERVEKEEKDLAVISRARETIRILNL